MLKILKYAPCVTQGWTETFCWIHIEALCILYKYTTQKLYICDPQTQLTTSLLLQNFTTYFEPFGPSSGDIFKDSHSSKICRFWRSEEVVSCVCGSHMYSRSSSCGRQTVDQFVWVSGLPLGPLTRFYLALLFSSDKYLILLSKASSLTRKRVCSLQWNHSLVPITTLYRLIWDCVPFLSPLTTRWDYGGGILTRLHTDDIYIYI
jgi:hypothetical protein